MAGGNDGRAGSASELASHPMTHPSRLPVPFLRHPWPYASALSLLGCLARVNVLTRRDLAALWISSASTAAQAADHLESLPHWVEEKTLGDSLRLRSPDVLLAFDQKRWWPAALRSFAPSFLDPLRYCPQCLAQGYHTHLFQLPWWLSCPVHEMPLCDACPRCQGALAMLPFRAEPVRAFHCQHCQWDLANTGTIVMASRHGVPEQWHRVVASHVRWRNEVSQAFVVAPTLTSAYCEVGPELALDWVGAAQVPWPTELRPYVVDRESGTWRLGLQVQHRVRTRRELRPLERLSAAVAAPPEPVGLEYHTRLFFARTAVEADTMLRLERRLQQAAGQPLPRRTRDWLYSSRPRKGGKRLLSPPNLSRFYFPEASGIRDRGYRRRQRDMTVSENVLGQVSIDLRAGELSSLSAVRLLCHMQDWMEEAKNLEESGPATAVVDWWYAHLLGAALVDGTIAATHAMAWMPPGSPEPRILPGWPPVPVEHHPPGHSWTLATIYRNGVSTTFLVPIPMAHLIGKAIARKRVLKERVLMADHARQSALPHVQSGYWRQSGACT